MANKCNVEANSPQSIQSYIKLHQLPLTKAFDITLIKRRKGKKCWCVKHINTVFKTKPQLNMQRKTHGLFNIIKNIFY